MILIRANPSLPLGSAIGVIKFLKEADTVSFCFMCKEIFATVGAIDQAQKDTPFSYRSRTAFCLPYSLNGVKCILVNDRFVRVLEYYTFFFP